MKDTEPIPLCVPEIAGNEWAYVKSCLETGWVSTAGGFVDRFEREFARTVGVEFCPTVLRFSTLYGVSQRMRFDLTVNEFTKDLLLKGHLTVYGGQFWRPYVHVRDAGRAILSVLDACVSAVNAEVFNVGATHQNYQKQTLADLISPLIPDGRVEYVHKEEDPRDYRVAFEKIQEVLGYQISRTVPDGIQEVAQLLRNRVIRQPDSEVYRN